MEPITIPASLNSNATHVLTFTNPLDNAAHFRVSLVGENPSEQFCLLLKRMRGILLQSGASLDIPVMFAPEAMLTRNIAVIVSLEERRGKCKESHLNLAWKYPIIGQPKLIPLPPDKIPKLTCPAKERTEQRLEVELVGCKMSEAAMVRSVTPTFLKCESATDLSGDCGENYTYQLVCPDEKFSNLVQISIGVKLVKRVIEEGSPVKLVFGIVFAPPRAFRYQ